MKFLKLIPILALAVTLAACGSTDNQASNDADGSGYVPEGPPSQTETPAVPASMVDGVQVIDVTVTDTGYEPSRIALKAGVPARITFDQKGTTECVWTVQIPDLNIGKTDIPSGERTPVEFTPEKPGEYGFTCGMHMLKGSLVVD